MTITNFTAWKELVGNEGCAKRLTFLHWFDYTNVFPDGHQFIPSHHDVLFTGPIDEVPYLHLPWP
jgi:hypothetical protein